MVNILKRFGSVLQHRFGTPQLPKAEELDESGVYMITDVERAFTRKAQYSILSNDGTSGAFGGSSITLVDNIGSFARIPYDDILFIHINWICGRLFNDFGFSVIWTTEVELLNNPQGVGTNGFNINLFRNQETIPFDSDNHYRFFDVNRTVDFRKLNLNAFNDETSIEQMKLISTATPTSGPATGDVRKEVLFNIEYALKSENPSLVP